MSENGLQAKLVSLVARTAERLASGAGTRSLDEVQASLREASDLVDRLARGRGKRDDDELTGLASAVSDHGRTTKQIATSAEDLTAHADACF